MIKLNRKKANHSAHIYKKSRTDIITSKSNDSETIQSNSDDIFDYSQIPSGDSNDYHYNKKPIAKKRRRFDCFNRAELILDTESDRPVDSPSDDSEKEDMNDGMFQSEDDNSNEMFTSPEFDDFDETSTYTNADYDNSWILLWIFKY